MAPQLTIGSAAVIGSALLAIGSLGHFSHLGFLSHNMAFIPIGLGTALCTAALLSLIYQRNHRGPTTLNASPMDPVFDAAPLETESDFDLSSCRTQVIWRHGREGCKVIYSGENLSIEDYKAILNQYCGPVFLEIDGVLLQKSMMTNTGYSCVSGRASQNLQKAIEALQS